MDTFTFEDTRYDPSGRNLTTHLSDYKAEKETYLNYTNTVFTDKLEAKSHGIMYKSRVLFTLLLNTDHVEFSKLYPYLELADVLKACEMLDAPRRMRQLQRKLEKDPNSKKLSVLLKKHVDAMNEVLFVDREGRKISFTSTRADMISLWTRQIPASKLEYMAMMFDTTQWRRLADLCHFDPVSEFKLDWFLRFCFGDPAPEDSVVHAWKNLNLDTFHEIYAKFYSPDFTYEIIRTKIDLKQTVMSSWGWYGTRPASDSPEVAALKDRIRETVIEKEGMTTVLWYWDELVTPRNIANIVVRLRKEKNVNLSYGKIADIISKTDDKEILSELVSLAERKAEQFSLSKECEQRVCPVAILCDASSSMEVAIKTSSIITSLLTCATNASLDVFGSDNLHIKNPPRTVEEGVKFGKEMKTRGCTCCASSIGHYYDRKQLVNTFIIVTDEEENTKYKNQMFDDVYLKYINEINPARLIFISFSNPNSDALMVRNLRKRMDPDVFASLVSVYKFDVKNPDMNRMDLVLRDLSKI